MKNFLNLTYFLLFSILITSPVFSQCPQVVTNSFTAVPTENMDLTCTWAITFDLDNSGGVGDESLIFSLWVDDIGNAKVEIINEDDYVCDLNGVPTGGQTISDSYNGSCDAIFYLDWKSYNEPDCDDEPCLYGSETTQVPAPVELEQFTGTAKHGLVELNWTTASEENNNYFEIQRSEDGKTFENIGVAEGQGTIETYSYYSFIDKFALPFAYYRLKQIDYDGTFSFSEIISVRRGDFESKLIVYPTQAFEEITIRLETLDSRKSFLKIGSASGQMMRYETYYESNNTEYLNIDISEYPPGIYFISLSDNSETVTAKFVVVKD